MNLLSRKRVGKMKIGPVELQIKDFKDIWSEISRLLSRRPKIEKNNANILFVDDEEFPIVKTLESSGWNVKLISDISNLQDESVVKSHVIFVDFKGVGKELSPEDEGLGLIKAIKDTYKDKKRVILYSGHTGFSLGHRFDWADGWMSKNSQAYQFITRIESELKEIK